MRRRRLRQRHAGLVDALGEQAAETVARERVEVERAHALQAQRAGEVVDRAARAGLEAAIGLFDQVKQGLARRGHAQRRCGVGGAGVGGLDRENHK